MMSDPPGDTAAYRRGEVETNSSFPLKNTGISGAVIVALTMVLLTVLLVLIYFFLFLYNRLKHPQKDQTGNEDAIAIAMDTIKFATNSEAQNPLVLTKDDLQGCKPGLEGSVRFDRPQVSPLFPPQPQPTLLNEKIDARKSRLSMPPKAKSVPFEERRGSGSEESNRATTQRQAIEEMRVRDDSMDQKFNSFPRDDTPKPGGFTRFLQAETGEKKRRNRMRQIEQDYTEYLQREMDSASKRIVVTGFELFKEPKKRGKP